MKAILITGTDTGVGKTVVACGLGLALGKAGLKVGVMKPFESGCRQGNEGLVPEDATKLAAVAFPAEDLDLICPYRFQSPLAPRVAAEIENRPIELSRVADCFDAILKQHDLTLVEGAGGLLVPVCGNKTYADLAKELSTPILLVVANKLGAVNHTLLTLEVAETRGITVLGYVLNQTESRRTAAAETNPATLMGMTKVPCLGEIPFLGREQIAARDFLGSLAFDLRKACA